jgi:hypothetical protein
LHCHRVVVDGAAITAPLPAEFALPVARHPAARRREARGSGRRTTRQRK